MGDFLRADLRDSRFERADLSGSEFWASDLARARFRGADLSGVVMRGVELVDVDISGEIQNLTINGVDIAPLVEAELDRRYPDRARMRPAEPVGFRAAWDTVERLWGQTAATGGTPIPVASETPQYPAGPPGPAGSSSWRASRTARHSGTARSASRAL